MGYPNPKDHYHIYNYLLANAEMPNASIIDKIRYGTGGNVNYAVDRGQLLKILSRLMSLLTKK